MDTVPLPAAFLSSSYWPAIRFYLPIPSYYLARLSIVKIYRSEDIGRGFHHNWQQCANYTLQFDYQRRVATIYPIFGYYRFCSSQCIRRCARFLPATFHVGAGHLRHQIRPAMIDRPLCRERRTMDAALVYVPAPFHTEHK